MDEQPPFRFLSNAEFQALDIDERLQYLARAQAEVARQIAETVKNFKPKDG
jgi:hypothetical protein